MIILGKTLDEWFACRPIIRQLTELSETSWFNPAAASVSVAQRDVGLSAEDIADASARLARFASYLSRAFPETAVAGGIIESDLRPLPKLQSQLAQRYQRPLPGSLWMKTDSHLPIAGSIKARGGIYEVLKHAETLALEQGFLRRDDDYATLVSDEARVFFGQYRIAVGSTGNLGLSIGIMGAKFGFAVTVHMSADARQWKKDLLRSHGVNVVEYGADYGVAVAAGRAEAESDPRCHFVDDENSADLFLGYAVAGERLKSQLKAAGVVVDTQHPLFVYLPCGVGGAPGGVAFGLKQAFGDAVHCIFAEPTHSPCMMLGVYTGLHDGVSVQDFGIDNVTGADGLAVGRPSGFVGKAMQRLIDGYYTVSDEELYRLVALTEGTEGIRLEPSAVAGIPGIRHVLDETQGYRERMGLTEDCMARATHIVWATGGSMVPTAEMNAYVARGQALLRA